MESKIFCLVLLGLIGAALCNPAPPPGVPIITDAEKDKICSVPLENINGTEYVCPVAGANHSVCIALATAGGGSNPRCVAKDVCAFTVPPSTGTPNPNPTTGSTPCPTTGTTGATGATGMTTSGPAPQPIPLEPNTIYISTLPLASNLIEIMGCPSGKKVFVYPNTSAPAGTCTIPANGTMATNGTMPTMGTSTSLKP